MTSLMLLFAERGKQGLKATWRVLHLHMHYPQADTYASAGHDCKLAAA